MSSRIAIAVFGLCWAGCTDLTVVVGEFDPSGGRGGHGGHGVMADAQPDAATAGRGAELAGAASPATSGVPVTADPPDVVSVDATPRAQFCAGQGLPLQTRRPAGSAADCGARLARKLFSYALCSCEDLSMPRDKLLVDSFDSGQGAYQPGQSGAAVGVDRSIVQLAADTQVFGSLIVAGANPLRLDGTRFNVIGDLELDATLEAGAMGAVVARDLWVGGDIRGPQAAIAVGRNVHQSAGRVGAELLAVSGQSYRADTVDIRPPCACDDHALLDIPALVAQVRNANDDASAGWTPATLRYGPFAADNILLPCGRLFVDEITVGQLSSIFLVFSGRTALFVAGDLTVAPLATLIVTQLSSGGELDIFVGGNLDIQSTLSLGGTNQPAAVRLYVAGQVRVSGVLGLGGNLYAPRATIELPPQPANLPPPYGSIFARSIHQLSSSELHYDRAIQSVDAECTVAAPQRCDACYQCPQNLACVAGRCGPCASDADCCGPFVCANGKCEPLQP